MAHLETDPVAILALKPGSDPAEFRRLLRASGPAVVILWAPPATQTEIGDVAAARRVRRDLRAILIDRPADANERVTALRSGFDEALDTRVDHAELAGRIDLLGQEIREQLAARRVQLGERVWLDRERRELVVSDKPVHLRPREFALLDVLARDP